MEKTFPRRGNPAPGGAGGGGMSGAESRFARRRILMVLTHDRLDCLRLCLDMLEKAEAFSRFDRVVLAGRHHDQVLHAEAAAGFHGLQRVVEQEIVGGWIVRLADAVAVHDGV